LETFGSRPDTQQSAL